MRTRYLTFFICVAAALLAFSQHASAQPADRQMPVAGKGGTWLFEYVNRTADEVELEGSFGDSREMTGTNGTWTCRIDSLPSEMYTYRYALGHDRYATDPLNPNTVRDIDDTLSYFILPGMPSSYYMDQPVAHGTVKQQWYPSSFSTDMKQRRLSIYLPPTYDSDPTAHFPVLYLLHGTGGDEMSWLEMGRLAQIMDNMIAEGKAKPMVVVMPNGIADLDAAPGQSPYMEGKARHSNVSSWMGRTEKAFPTEVVAFIEANYRVQKDKHHRAIAGLSMGGLHTIAISANNPQMFDYVGLFSPQTTNALTELRIKGIQGVTNLLGKVKERLPQWLENKYDDGQQTVADVDVYKNLNDKLKTQFATPPALYYIAIGKRDPLKHFVDIFRQRISKQGCAYMYKETDGAHTWENWRKYLLDFLPRLF